MMQKTGTIAVDKLRTLCRALSTSSTALGKARKLIGTSNCNHRQ